MDRLILPARWNVRNATLVIALATVLLAIFASAAYAVVKYGGPGDDTITGTNGADTIYGREGNDTIYGLGSGDRLIGNEDNDTIYGQDGTDQLYGQDGNDKLYGGNSDDRLAGHYGDDLLVGEGGRTDEFFGGPGYDTCVVEGPEHAKPHNLSGCEVVTNKLP